MWFDVRLQDQSNHWRQENGSGTVCAPSSRHLVEEVVDESEEVPDATHKHRETEKAQDEEEDQDDDNEESEKDEEEFHAEEEAGNATMPTQRSEGEKHKSRSVPMI